MQHLFSHPFVLLQNDSLCAHLIRVSEAVINENDTLVKLTAASFQRSTRCSIPVCRCSAGTEP